MVEQHLELQEIVNVVVYLVFLELRAKQLKVLTSGVPLQVENVPVDYEPVILEIIVRLSHRMIVLHHYHQSFHLEWLFLRLHGLVLHRFG
jgi:hypothetical protein